MTKKILCVDDEPNNLQVLRQILKDKYQLAFAPNGEKALNAAKKHKPDMVLLDIMMPDMSGYEVCLQLKKDPELKDIPVIFVTAMSDVDDEAKGFDMGAVDYIQKPVSASIVLRRVENHLSLIRVNVIEETQKAAVFMLGEAGHFNDTDTGVHIWRMSAYARILADELGWDTEQAEMLELAAPMHDTGKIGISDNILKAPRKLKADEWKIMQTHSELGNRILKNGNTPLFKMAANIALYHHERWDGSGYPSGLSGENIDIAARIVAIADVFDALTMQRPYKEAWSLEEALNEIERGSGSHFDPKLVKIFINSSSKIVSIKEMWDKQEKKYNENT